MRLVLIKFWRQRLEIMLFNSIVIYIVYFTSYFILYYLLPGKIKDIALVAGGAVFLHGEPRSIWSFWYFLYCLIMLWEFRWKATCEEEGVRSSYLLEAY